MHRRPEHDDRDRCVMDVQRPGRRTFSRRVGFGLLMVVIMVLLVYVSSDGIVVRVYLPLPDPGQEQTYERSAEQ